MARGGNPNTQALELDISRADYMRDRFEEILQDPLHDTARRVHLMLKDHPGAEVFIVGGGVRDLIADRDPKDIDLMVRGVPADELLAMLKTLPGSAEIDGESHTIHLHNKKDHPVVEGLLSTLESDANAAITFDEQKYEFTVKGSAGSSVMKALKSVEDRVTISKENYSVMRYRNHKGSECEVVLPRTEVSTGDGHGDFKVTGDHTLPVKDDLLRRDFTVNAMAWDMNKHILIDPYGGQDHMEQKVLQTVSEKSFTDDRLRMLRGVVLAGRYSLVPSKDCHAQYEAERGGLSHITRPRVHDEVYKLMKSPDPASGVKLGDQYGMWDYALDGLRIDPSALESAQSEVKDPELRLAILLHENKAEKIKTTLHEIKYSSNSTERVSKIISAPPAPSYNDDKSLSNWVESLGSRAMAKDALTVQSMVSTNALSQEIPRYEKAMDRPIFRSEIALTGKDLIAQGVKPGPQMGILLRKAQELVWEDSSLNDKQTLCKMLNI